MPIRSLEQLGQFLDDELKWRKRELTTLKLTIEKSRPHEKGMLLRAAVCLLYAHWEGFVKAAATGYVSYVATRGLRYRDLTPNFVALGLRSEIRNAGQSNNLPTLHTELVNKLMSGLSERSRINWAQAVNTGSNLNEKALDEILCLLGLDATEYSLKGPIINQRLLANRNGVAHGENLSIEPDDYYFPHDNIIQLVERFRTDVENAAVNGNYRVSPTL